MPTTAESHVGTHSQAKLHTIYDLPLRKGRGAAGVLGVWVTVFCSIALGLTPWLKLQELQPVLLAVGVAAFGLLCWAAIDLGRREKEYIAALQHFDLSTLKRSAESAEFDGRSQVLVIQYLNRVHPGWDKS